MDIFSHEIKTTPWSNESPLKRSKGGRRNTVVGENMNKYCQYHRPQWENINHYGTPMGDKLGFHRRTNDTSLGPCDNTQRAARGESPPLKVSLPHARDSKERGKATVPLLS